MPSDMDLHKDAGSAAQFRKVDLEYVAATARAAKAGGAKHLALVSSQGANAKLWANDWSICHGLLYAQVKGLAEQATIKAGIPSTSIFRPGLLERGAKARGVESAFKNVVSSLPVSGLGQLMVLDAIKAAEKRKEQGGAPGAQETKFYEMNELLKALKQGPRAPRAT
ncbi:hypothetical protein DUNSADRAFT_14275 [Dunaliella salina]|uniref:NAD(P)-binding domain-containing protein n=1 Tax=Dunaliella salina TaxID=3046 RepID=A0ABQ7H2L8_DUNSA|nr:hypothetical protein DUNSADRAFT_14275 [Dunaliella salina]|eukprot:KAF5841100.1 hypothetical protein DUNSADRAFT_14275 [Dunaliella salina]